MSTGLRLTTTPAGDLSVDALVVIVAPHGESFEFRHDGELTKDASKALHALLAPLREGLRSGRAVVVPSAGSVPATLIAFAWTPTDEREAVRKAVGAGVDAVADRGQIAVISPDPTPQTVAAVAQGALLGAYRYRTFRTVEADHREPSITVITSGARKKPVKEAVARAQTVAEAVVATRDLVNAPPSHLGPADLADAVRRAAADTSVRVETWDERKLERGGFGGILAVGQGSARPPRLVRMSYRPARASFHLVLVGKGITFDSGGLSLKPAKAMETMKSDMAGAAAVAMATLAVARLHLPIKITSYLALAENMPSGTAQRPGDVLTTYNGTTVEVLNTDAEGRLVLADALSRAVEDSPDLLVDVATLTGAQIVALGTHVSAVMAGDDDSRALLTGAAEEAGESMWPMPLPPELRASLDSKIADIANIGERMGGMMTAALFLKEFTGDVPWAHLDIAGPSFNEGTAHGYTPAGGTGVAVRTLVQLADDLAG